MCARVRYVDVGDCSAGLIYLVRMGLDGQFSVCLLDFFIIRIFVHLKRQRE